MQIKLHAEAPQRSVPTRTKAKASRCVFRSAHMLCAAIQRCQQDILGCILDWTSLHDCQPNCGNPVAPCSPLSSPVCSVWPFTAAFLLVGLIGTESSVSLLRADLLADNPTCDPPSTVQQFQSPYGPTSALQLPRPTVSHGSDWRV